MRNCAGIPDAFGLAGRGQGRLQSCESGTARVCEPGDRLWHVWSSTSRQVSVAAAQGRYLSDDLGSDRHGVTPSLPAFAAHSVPHAAQLSHTLYLLL